jgi:hypothetical protein
MPPAAQPIPVTSSPAAQATPTATPAPTTSTHAPQPPRRRDYTALLRRWHELKVANFQARYPDWKRPADESAEAEAPKKPRPAAPSLLMRPWILGVTVPPRSVDIEVQVLGSGVPTDDGGYVTFRVLGANDDHAVLGLVVRGETHLRLMPTGFLPINTAAALIATRGRSVGDESYTGRFRPEMFREAAFDRPAAGASSAGRVERVHLIQGGKGTPLNAYSCTGAMRQILLEQVRWKDMPNGRNVTKRFQLVATDPKTLPTAVHAIDGPAIVERYNGRGHTSAATIEEVAAVMRDAGTVLPYWPRAATCDGATQLRAELQAWLSPAAGVASIRDRAVSVEVAVADAAAAGRALTFRALRAADPALQRTATRRDVVDPTPRLVLCNGQTTAAGRQRVPWAAACACKCGMQATAGLTGESLRKRCGDDGRTRALADQRRKGKSSQRPKK